MKHLRAVLRSAATVVVVVGLISGCSSNHSASPTPSGAPPNGPVGAPRAPSAPAAGGCTLPAGTASGLSAPPTGLVAFTIYQKGKVPFPERVFSDPLVSGVALAMRWDTLEPAPNTFDWSALDCVFAQADTHHKFVTLAVTPGFESPGWVLKLPGVQTQSFKFAYFTNDAPSRSLPLPWNEAYLQAWFTFLGALAARYANNPVWRLIGVGGPTSVSTEMSLPGRRSGDTALPASANGSDVAEWIALGYTPDTYVNAWTESFDRYHQLFPHQHLGLALYPALPIGNNRAEDKRAAVTTMQRVIDAGMRYKPQFDLQENGIRGGAPRPSDPEYNAVRTHCGEIVTGLQNSKSATDDPAYQGPLTNALDHVLAAGVDFWEVYVSDVDNPSMSDVLKRASTQLPAHTQCRH